MTIRELIGALGQFDDPEKDVDIVLCKMNGTSQVLHIEEIKDNNGNAQLEIHEFGDVIDEYDY